MQRRPTRLRLPVALAAAAALAAAPAAIGAATPGATSGPDAVDHGSKLQPFSVATATAVAARNDLTLRTTIPEIGWAVVQRARSDDRRDRARPSRTTRPVWRTDAVQPGRADVPGPDAQRHDLHPAGPGVAGQLTASWNWHWTITNFPAAWDIARGEGQRVAIIDSEFDTEHIELKPKILTGKNFDSGTAGVPARPPSGRTTWTSVTQTLHGSHVAGLVAAVADNANGAVGRVLRLRGDPLQDRACAAGRPGRPRPPTRSSSATSPRP